MLVPGEYLTCPVPPEQIRAPLSPRVAAERPLEPRLAAPMPAIVADAAESRSFLLILLRALGAVHS